MWAGNLPLCGHRSPESLSGLGGNREAKSTVSQRRESRSEISAEQVCKFRVCLAGTAKRNQWGNALHVAGPCAQGVLDHFGVKSVAGPCTQGVLDPEKR